ncbi:PHD finger protein 10-like isoform X2 [Dreissena polymorpha]|uniref:PHD finger protein 10 n=1 Tax=Dreissena polymorpha TaxID=45954 RepID=A0A9D4R2G5_DREPO|nr:PHD finger protein 10-like isoform X2 [Dreissena polymorpha]KAH3852509.1 hypothetical protein DPMN_095019 [Dreissena polymorpha]
MDTSQKDFTSVVETTTNQDDKHDAEPMLTDNDDVVKDVDSQQQDSVNTSSFEAHNDTDVENKAAVNTISALIENDDSTKNLFGNNFQSKKGADVVKEPVKDNYESEFHKFLKEENRACNNEHDTDSVKDIDESSRPDSTENEPASAFVGEDTSNSDWYKPNIDEGCKTSEANNLLGVDEASNVSVPGSAASSNVEDMDECSNMSLPESSAFSDRQMVFDESANMNPPSNCPFVTPGTPNSERDKNGDNTPAKKRRGTLQIAADDASEHGHGLTASDIFEYAWPQEPDADFYMLQEQISIFLDIKSFKRKYPDLFRRVCDKHEKDFLRESGVVSETQSDLGLTALKADEVHDLMSKDYPAKYKEFVKTLQEKEKQKMADKIKEFNALKLEKDKMAEYTKKAMKSVSDWNRNLLKERKESRRAYFDVQTFTFQYPRNKFRKLDTTHTEVGAYPLSVIPGQFQDYYKTYLMEELKYFPLNTAVRNPPKHSDLLQNEDEADSGDESSSSRDSEDESSSGSSSSDSDEDSVEEEPVKVLTEKSSASHETSKEKSLEPRVRVKQETECRICKDEPEDKWKIDEEIIECSECKSKGHPSCLDLTDEMVKVVRTYPWQCMECKTCVQCMDPYDEDKMLFCDKCDRGYHTFCVGLTSLPRGEWDCPSCRGDTTPLKPLPRPTPRARRGRKQKDPNTPRRPPGRPPKDKSKLQERSQEVAEGNDNPEVAMDTTEVNQSEQCTEKQGEESKEEA